MGSEMCIRDRLVLLNTVIYVSVSWMPFTIFWYSSWFGYFPFWSFSIVPFLIIFYNIIEMFLFIRYKKWSWPVTLTFRILWVLNNAGLLITCGIFFAYRSDICSYHGTWCEHTILLVPMSLHYVAAFVLEIVTLVVYSKLPRNKMQCCRPKVVTAMQYPIVIVNEDGTIQSANQIQPGQLVYLVNESKPVTSTSTPSVPSFSNPSFQETNDSIEEE